MFLHTLEKKKKKSETRRFGSCHLLLSIFLIFICLFTCYMVPLLLHPSFSCLFYLSCDPGFESPGPNSVPLHMWLHYSIHIFCLWSLHYHHYHSPHCVIFFLLATGNGSWQWYSHCWFLLPWSLIPAQECYSAILVVIGLSSGLFLGSYN